MFRAVGALAEVLSHIDLQLAANRFWFSFRPQSWPGELSRNLVTPDNRCPMSVEFQCPSCGRKLRVPQSALGKNVRCSGCHQVFTARTLSYDESEPEAKPATRRKLRTHRAALILTMGIVGVGLGLMALPMAFGGTATRLVGLAASVLALPIAIGAWSMAKTDW